MAHVAAWTFQRISLNLPIGGIGPDKPPQDEQDAFATTVDMGKVDQQRAAIAIEFGQDGGAAHGKGNRAAEGQQLILVRARQCPQNLQRDAFNFDPHWLVDHRRVARFRPILS
ncbi:hypothetical protein [Mesorhizobium sp. M1163]|uniref:hypothetical protein n=1 Tax=Mesorhizobium sp. M1163 TaxID=2957065 RepID=UPI00333C7C4F